MDVTDCGSRSTPSRRDLKVIWITCLGPWQQRGLLQRDADIQICFRGAGVPRPPTCMVL